MAHSFVPVDTVKSKSGERLRRLANIDADPRCVLLVEHWSEDWTKLWWVRAHGEGRVLETPDSVPWHSALEDRYEQYRRPGAITGGIEITMSELTGWAATDPA